MEPEKEGKRMLLSLLPEQAKNDKLFEWIVTEFGAQMLWVAETILSDPEDGKEAVQEALLGMFRNTHRLPVEDEKRLRAYALTAARNAAINTLPEKKRREERLDDLPIPGEEDLFEKVAAQEDYDFLLRAIRRLPQRYREVLLLILVEDNTVEEAAKLLCRKPGTVRQQLSRGKRRLVEVCRGEGMDLEA